MCQEGSPQTHGAQVEGAIIVARALVFGFKFRDDLDLRFERGLICGTSARGNHQHQDHPDNKKGDQGADLLCDGALERLPATITVLECHEGDG